MARLRIMIIEDDPDVRSATVDLLGILKVDVIEAPNGNVALDMIIRQPPDIVVVDLNMPIMGGMTLVNQLRKNRFPMDRVLIYSGSMDQHRVLTLAQLKVKNFFVKPVAPSLFLDRIRQMAGVELI